MIKVKIVYEFETNEEADFFLDGMVEEGFTVEVVADEAK